MDFGSVYSFEIRQFSQMTLTSSSSDQSPKPDSSSGTGNENVSIYKILHRSVWAQIRTQTLWDGSPDDLRDGFIHFSTKSQLDGTLRKHFAGQSDLVILELAASSLGPNLKWEVSRNGELFPHLYEPMPIKHVRSVSDAVT